MVDLMYRDMLEATRLTRAGQLAEATKLLQRALTKNGPPHTARDANRPLVGRIPRAIDITPDKVEVMDIQSSAERAPASMTESDHSVDTAEEAIRRVLPKPLYDVLSRLNQIGSVPGTAERGRRPSRHARNEIAAGGGQFLARTFSNDAGHRIYKLYVPTGYQGKAVPLIVMLHGCTQSPDDFAVGTRMNTIAEEHTFLVAYPAQSASANISKCWNWFNPGDQERDRGEPSLIAGITRQIIRDYSIDPRRVYIAGLSAGAAAAAVMGMAYPDLYAAVGVHSGLACGLAHDVASAFAAMRQGDPSARRRGGAFSAFRADRPLVPTIVFHGDQDTTVNPCNGDHVIAQQRMSADLQTTVQQGQARGGHAYSCTVYTDPNGRPLLEQWIIAGAGHAWSGGSPAGSFTDNRGPDASREMLRFFFEHSHPTIAAANDR